MDYEFDPVEMDYEGNTRKRKRSAIADPAWNTSSASASAAGGAYEVFLSFRGKDTRYGFTDFLYTDLVDAGIHTFRDDEELRVGEEIGPELLKAIQDSKISIPIFSSDYASSKWCLRELVQMVKCRKTMGQKIIPIFYDVEPSDVRHQTGNYKEALYQHEMIFGEKIVKEWKEALGEIGELKGWELKKETNGHQGELVKMVVSKVLLELKNYMFVTNNLVRIDHHLEEIMRLLNVDSNDVSIVGIHGMGGIGKTTIAKIIYNQLFKSFDCCCFLADVREKSQQHKDIVSLQNQLISKILKCKCPEIVDVDEGINRIKDIVFKKKVLIVLDDVDKRSQFDKLAGERDWFGPKSRIIITTRNKEVLDTLEVDGTFEPPFMEPEHSLQLFSKHAFRRDFPPKDYVVLSRKVVYTAAGLPLALEVFGSLLLGQGKAVWEDTLKKLNKIPNNQVEEKLIISFEALDNEQKQIFLDIACFFIGEDKSKPFYMWDDCEFYPTNGINVLTLRSLVKIVDDNKLWMHDQLKDLGRYIIRKENLKELGKRSRLWLHEEALDVLEGHKGTKKVEALCLETYGFFKMPHKHCFTDKEFGKLQNLRFLRADCIDLAGDFKHLFSNLRWLQWRGCPENFTPTSFHPKNLVILDLSRSNITKDWKAWSQIKMAKKLKVLDLSKCVYLERLPDLSHWGMLEELNLHGCHKLAEVESLWVLKFLKILDMSVCESLERLPDLSHLGMLEELHLRECYKLVEVKGIGVLKSLKTLDMSSCVSLKRLPDFSHLEMLEELKLRGCHKLVLDLSKCVYLERLPDLSHWGMLEELNLHGCHKLAEVESLWVLKFLKILDMSVCESLERLPDLSHLGMLEELHLRECYKLVEVKGIGVLKSLKILDMSSCVSLKRLPDFSHLEMLEELKLRGCHKLVLDLSNCVYLERLPDLSHWGMLEELNLHGCHKLAEVESLWVLKFLKILDMSVCESLERLPDLSHLGMLEELHLRECYKLVEVKGIGVLKSLKTLDMSACESLERLPDISHLGMLEELHLRECYKLVEVKGIGVLKSLKTLDMSACESLERLPDLSHLGMLEELHLRECHKLVEVKGIGLLKSLKTLDMSWCVSLKRLPDLSHLEMLEELKLRGCHKLVEVEGFWVLKSLKKLDVSDYGIFNAQFGRTD